MNHARGLVVGKFAPRPRFRPPRGRILHVQPQIGKATSEEIARTVPKPHGQAKCPSTLLLRDCQWLCHRASEVWAWINFDPRVRAFVSFDSQGKLSDVIVQKL